MSVPLKIVLLMFISTVLGESTQDENIPSHIDRRLRELEIMLAEQSVKISFLEKETSKQETAHYELVNKVTQELSQSRVSQRYEWQTRFDESIEKLQNNMKDGWLNISETWNKSVNAIANEIKSEVVSNIQTIAENEACQADKKIDLEQNVDLGRITSANQTGQWLSWGAWSYCPQMECNAHYHQSRTRSCYDSDSQQEVHDCIGTSLENKTCDYTCTGHTFVGFDAKLNTNLKGLRAGHVINFNGVFTNTGNGYKNGVFTCPVPGVYYFSWTILADPGKNSDTWFMLNGKSKRVNYSRDHTGKQYYSGTVSILLHLNKGDRVWIQMRNNNSNAHISHSFFSGMLMKSD